MASPNVFHLQSNFECAICLDIFVDPVSTPCGHNFCKVCIDTYWDDRDVFLCPICKQRFEARPHLHVNGTLRDLADQFKQMAVSKPNKKKAPSTKPPKIVCDGCTGDKRAKALKSCLECEVSLCAEHLKPHQKDSDLKRHVLLGPVQKLKDRVCKEHRKPLDFVCKSDLTAVCVTCIESDHRAHEWVPLEGRLRRAKDKAEQALVEVHEKIKERKEMVKNVEHSVELSKKFAKTDTEEMLKLFPALATAMETVQESIMASINKQQYHTEQRCLIVIGALERETSELEGRRSELERLVLTEDHLQLLQDLPSLSALPATEDWSEVSAYSDPGVGLVRSGLNGLLCDLLDILKAEKRGLVKNEIKRIQQYAVDVTLDPDTANPILVLSEDGKEVRHGASPQDLPDIPERFATLLSVLGKQGYTSGAFYFQVQVEGKTSWDIGVALAMVDRKDASDIDISKGYCALMHRGENMFFVCDRPPARIHLNQTPQMVGVFVDYDAGEVGFYDIGNMTHIYSYTGKGFPNCKLYPYFSPRVLDDGENSAPLVISPVSQAQSFTTQF